MDKQEEKRLLDALRRKLKAENGFLGISLKRNPMKRPDAPLTEDDFIELFESDLKELKTLGEMVVAEMKDGKEYYLVPTIKDNEAYMESMAEQHPQLVRITEETIANVSNIAKLDKAKRLVTFNTKDGEVTHEVEDRFWDKFITVYNKHNN
ncbi:hypothetical protein [Paenibacillus sp. 1A_MP2]|uniref:hypothetical protein n=1 Tax=Paenibacillus sp. 1A_MP2 TaxID=3457495 RepID=UPI003FCE7339